jgi:hypothetical protein
VRSNNFLGPVEQQQAFNHGIEEHLLLRLGINAGLLLPALRGLDLRDPAAFQGGKTIAPPEMQTQQCAKGDYEQKEPHRTAPYSIKR